MGLTLLCVAGLRGIRPLSESVARQREMPALNCSHINQVSAYSGPRDCIQCWTATNPMVSST